MANKPTTVTEEDTGRKPNGAVINQRELVFPQDDTGFTTLLRKEGTRAVGRIGGDPKRLAVFKATLRVLAQHAETKIKHQQEVRAQQVVQAEELVKAERARAEKDRVEEVARLERNIAALTATKDAKVAEAPDAG